MRVHPCHLAPRRQTDVVFGQSRLWMAIGMGVCLLLIGAGVVITVDGAGAMGWVFTGFAVLATLPLLLRMRRAFSADNWLLRLNSRQLLIRIAPALGRTSPADCVIELAHDQIEWVRAHRQTTVTREAGDIRADSAAWLEIKPRSLNLELLRACIQAAAKPRTWRGFTILEDLPVRITADGLIRLQWRGRHSFISPSLKKAIALLRQHFPVQPEVYEHNDFTIPDADKQKMEQQIVEFVEQGRLIDATKLARQRYGHSLTEARQFVEQLRGGQIAEGSASSPGRSVSSV